MAEQLKHLLMVDNSPFERDPNFAFIVYNMVTKKSVFSRGTREVGMLRTPRTNSDADVRGAQSLPARLVAYHRAPDTDENLPEHH